MMLNPLPATLEQQARRLFGLGHRIIDMLFIRKTMDVEIYAKMSPPEAVLRLLPPQWGATMGPAKPDP